jgi:amphi-Trp domain-containing protein
MGDAESQGGAHRVVNAGLDSAPQPIREDRTVAKADRDVERIYATRDVVAKLRRLADALEREEPFRIQIGGERIRVPARAEFSVEHEREEGHEEIEFQLTWSLDTADDEPDGDDVV